MNLHTEKIQLISKKLDSYIIQTSKNQTQLQFRNTETKDGKKNAKQ